MRLHLAVLDPGSSCDLALLPIREWELALPFFSSLPAGTRAEVERAYVAVALYNREICAVASREPPRPGRSALRDNQQATRRADVAFQALRRASTALDARVSVDHQPGDQPLLEAAPESEAVLV
jgi:hypothetical protein